MNAEMILIRDVHPSAIQADLSDAIALGQSGKTSSHAYVFPSRERNRASKRVICLVPSPTVWTLVLESGSLADECICESVSRGLATQGIIIGVYQTSNAWAVRLYDHGFLLEERFEPAEAFMASSKGGRVLEGDANELANSYLVTHGWPYGLIVFAQALSGKVPWSLEPGSVVRVHLSG